MQKNDVRKSMRKFVTKVLLVSAFVMVLSNASYMLMTWICTELLHIENDYLSSEVRFLGALVIAMCFLFILFIVSYRRRKRELIKLTDYIEKVANGDFSARILYNKKDSNSQVYSDLNRMAEELHSVQVLRSDFINSFSHEFKTPIASINGFSSLMLEKDLSREEERQYLQIIKEESERLSKMTNNTILLTRLSSREVVDRVEEYDLGEQLRQCSILLSHQWMEKELDFESDFPQIRFWGNRELLQHLWINLIGNAVKYTPRGGEIFVKVREIPENGTPLSLNLQGSLGKQSLSAKQNKQGRTDAYGISERGNKVKVTITDTGIGMSEETLAQIFDAYYQGDDAHANPGLGLGLSIAHEIVGLCGGTIQAVSKPGEGSCFTVVLPNEKRIL